MSCKIHGHNWIIAKISQGAVDILDTALSYDNATKSAQDCAASCPGQIIVTYQVDATYVAELSVKKHQIS